MRKLILTVCLLSAVPLVAVGETVYVSDKLETQLRSGPSTQHKVIRELSSGVPLNVIEKDSGYTHVTTENGTDGWILTRHTAPQPAARVQLEGISQKVDSLTQENKQLLAEVDDLKKRLAEANSAKEEASAHLQRNSSELAQIRQASASSVALLEERNQLLEKSATLENELESLRREKDSLSEKDSQDWFLKGAGVLFGGLLLGVILPKLGGRKRNNWDSF